VGQGIDLAAYDLRAIAADLGELQVALGIGTWNISGNGTSSRILFELAAERPTTIRALIADSPMLPSPDAFSLAPSTLDAAINQLATSCAAEPGCAARTPDVRAAIDEAARKLDAEPVQLEVAATDAGASIGHPVKVVVDGAALLRWIRASLAAQGGEGAATAIQTVLRVLDGRLTADDPMPIALATDPDDCIGIALGCDRISFGALYSIECRDLAQSLDRAKLTEAIAGRPAWADLFAPETVLAPCAAWSVPPSGAFPASNPTLGIRSLLLRGRLDPFTIPQAQLDGIANDPATSLIEVPNQSYNVLGFTECPRAIRNAWLDATSGPPADTSCLAGIPAISLQP